MIAGSEEAILMIEGYADFLTEEKVLEAISAGHDAIKVICQKLGEWQKEIGKTKDRSSLRAPSKKLEKEIKTNFTEKFAKALSIKEKHPREDAVSLIKEEIEATYFVKDQEPLYTTSEVGSSCAIATQ